MNKVMIKSDIRLPLTAFFSLKVKAHITVTVTICTLNATVRPRIVHAPLENKVQRS